jgi:hypothetical protein
MTRNASDRLIERVRPFKGDSSGIAIEHIAKMPLTPTVVADILECVRNNDITELGWGLWFAQGILDSQPPRELLKFIVAELPKWIRHEATSIREGALPLLIRLRENFPNYRAVMLECLKDTDPEVRIDALAAYSTFLTNKDIQALLDFQRDDYMSETSMNSPLVFLIRNQALEIIERLCGQKLPKHENVKMLEDGHTVYWWDWKPFLDWWKKSQK